MSSKLILIDARAPEQAMQNLRKWGEVMEFITHRVVYDAIAGHPDIFMYQWPGGLVVAPQLPSIYLNRIRDLGVDAKVGGQNLGNIYPHTAHYNASYTSYGILHNVGITGKDILNTHPHFIHCAQGYARCNALEVAGCILTSDEGIAKVLKHRNIPHLYINPKNVYLSGHQHGFFPGCCGYFDCKLFVCGSIDLLEEAPLLKREMLARNVAIVEIFSGSLHDVGGVFFL